VSSLWGDGGVELAVEQIDKPSELGEKTLVLRSLDVSEPVSKIKKETSKIEFTIILFIDKNTTVSYFYLLT